MTGDLNSTLRELEAEIEQRKHAQKELEESEQRYRSLFQSTHDMVQSVSPEGKFLFVNPAWKEVLGYADEELEQRSIFDIIHPEALPHCLELFQRIMGGEKGLRIETTFVAKDGRSVLIEGSASPRLINDDVVATHGFFRDITEERAVARELAQMNALLEERVDERTAKLKEAQEELVRNERLAILGQIAGSVAHEIRNPLSIVRNVGYYLSNAFDNADEDTRQSLIEMDRGLARADRIIHQLLDYTRDPKVEHEPFSVDEVIDQVLKDVSLPESADVQRASDTALESIGNSLQVEMLLGNLVRNAIDAMPDGGTLSLQHYAIDDRYLVLEVIDTGTGIDEEDVAKIFEPLFSRKVNGIGLGLSISKRYAELNKGNLEVESVVGEGSTFRLTLPLYTPPG